MRSRSIAWRLALAFAAVCALVLGAIGVFLHRSLASELAWRDDMALLGRLEQVRALLADSDSLDALQARPRLYQNMLGNLDSLLLVQRADGSKVITINPRQRALPPVQAIPRDQPPQRSDVLTWQAPDGAELALVSGQAQGPNGESLTVIAGKVLSEREQMLGSYRLRLYLAVGLGAVLAFTLGLVLLRRGLLPLRKLSEALRGVDLRSLDQRVPTAGTPAELLEPVHALNGMLVRLDDGFQRLSQFSADLAHEIRTPLHTLLASNGQALNHPRSSAEYQEVLASNMEEFERLKRMAENLMFLARAEQAERALDLRPLELRDIGDELCDYFEALADDRGIRLENTFSGELLADQQLLQRALGNLLANAVRHADAGSVISLCRRDEPGMCWLQVQNLGPVIAEEHLGKLFDRFYRVDPSRAEPGDSGGLGLAIVQSIMQLHGGRVRVSSDATGTVFELGFAAI
ncbi:heavy metal sensor histidine kinase [Pseudomonas sp. SDO52101_S400]